MPEDTTTIATTTAGQEQGETPASWEAWIEAQPEDVKGLYNTHVEGLRNTVRATRDERDALKDQLKELGKKAETGSELEKSLNEALAKIEQTERRAAFVEDAVRPEIGCSNPKAAYALAQAEGLFDRKGAADWNAIKAAAPELFKKPSAAGNAGNGTSNPPKANTMNDYIRRAAGRQ
jgi:hypothetical protein